MYLIGKGYDVEEIKKLMQIDICGEQTISQYNFVFENNSSASSDNFELEVAIPSTLREEDLFEAVVRIKEITDRELLAICNLSNLRMEFAKIKYKETDTENEVNHTIYLNLKIKK